MPLYEHVFLARQDVSQQQVETLTKEFTDVITEGGGKVTKTENWGVKGLASTSTLLRRLSRKWSGAWVSRPT